MNGAVVFVLAVATVLAASAIAVSGFTLWRSQALIVTADARTRAGAEQHQATVEALRTTVASLSAQVRELQNQPSPAGVPGVHRSGLNLSKRSQVLRMHRKGDPPDQIAAALEVPLQEVDLLIKVHRIVIRSI